MSLTLTSLARASANADAWRSTLTAVHEIDNPTSRPHGRPFNRAAALAQVTAGANGVLRDLAATGPLRDLVSGVAWHADHGDVDRALADATIAATLLRDQFGAATSALREHSGEWMLALDGLREHTGSDLDGAQLRAARNLALRGTAVDARDVLSGADARIPTLDGPVADTIAQLVRDAAARNLDAAAADAAAVFHTALDVSSILEAPRAVRSGAG